MATIHSLPQELIRHILALAYVHPGEFSPAHKRRKRGLCAAALVHRSWTAPAQALLAHDLRLRNLYRQGTRRREDWTRVDPMPWIERVPEGVACRHLVLQGDEAGAAEALVRKARAGSVRTLAVDVQSELAAGFFAAPALSGLESLDLGNTPQLNRLGAWPPALRHLKFNPDRAGRPALLFSSVAATLTSLELDSFALSELSAFPALITAAPSFAHLTSLVTTYDLYSPHPDPDPDSPAPALAQLVPRLPALATLALTTHNPAHLARVLNDLPHLTLNLRALRTTVFAPDSGLLVHLLLPAERAAWPARWAAGAAACAEAKVVGQLEEWRFEVQADVGTFGGAAAFGEEEGAAWEAAQAAVAARGVRFEVAALAAPGRVAESSDEAGSPAEESAEEEDDGIVWI